MDAPKGHFGVEKIDAWGKKLNDALPRDLAKSKVIASSRKKNSMKKLAVTFHFKSSVLPGQ